MKTRLLSFLFFIPLFSFSQGQITGISVDPPSPTTADFVTVYVDMSFSSGSCFPDYANHSTIGNSTTASALHCLGMLTVICPYTDTFELGYLQAGTHQFDFTLSTGGGGPGCSPGIVPDDDSTFSFMVTNTNGIDEANKNDLVRFFPNPMGATAKISIDPSLIDEGTQLIILDATGREIFSLSANSNEIILENKNLSSGIYFYQLRNEKVIIATDKFVVE